MARNYLVRGGELDLVAKKKDVIVFIEVKYRKTARFGHADEFVNMGKQKRLKFAAKVYMSENGLNPEQVYHRFDVVAIDGLRLRHITDAFS